MYCFLEKTVPVSLDGISVPEGYEIHSALPQNVTVIGQKEVLKLLTKLKPPIIPLPRKIPR